MRLTHLSILFISGTQANIADPDQTPHNVASDQSLHCLLINMFYYFFNIKNEEHQPATLGLKRTRPIDRNGKIHSTCMGENESFSQNGAQFLETYVSFVCFVALRHSQQLWSWRDGQFT